MSEPNTGSFYLKENCRKVGNVFCSVIDVHTFMRVCMSTYLCSEEGIGSPELELQTLLEQQALLPVEPFL